MANRKSTEPNTVNKSTLLTVAIVCLSVGFLGGVVFSAYKSSPKNRPQPAMPPPQAAPDHSADIDAMKKEIERNPKNVSAWTQLGNLYFDSDQFDNAIKAYQRSLELNPKNANVWTDLGVMYRRKGDPQKAIDSFDRAMQADPKHEVSHFNKGIVLLHDLNDPPRRHSSMGGLVENQPVCHGT